MSVDRAQVQMPRWSKIAAMKLATVYYRGRDLVAMEIAPGELVQAELVETLREAAAGGTRMAYCADPSLGTLQVVAR